MHRARSIACSGVVSLALAVAPFAAKAMAQGAGSEDIAACITITPGAGGMLPNNWHKTCDFVITVKWFDEGYCAQGCVRTLENEFTSFNNIRGEHAFAACRGAAGPIGFDAIDDSDYTCPA